MFERLAAFGYVVAVPGFWLAAVSGALYALAYPGAGAWPLVFVAFVPLLRALDDADLHWSRALGLGLTSGFVAQLMACHWLLATLHEFARLPWLLAAAATLGLCAYQGGVFALFAWLCWMAKRRGRALSVFAPLSMAAAEFLYPALFPSYVGAVVRPLALLQLAELGGPALVTLLAMSVNAAVHVAWTVQRTGLASVAKRRAVLRPLVVAGACLLLAYAYGAVRITQLRARIASAPRLTVGVVQANARAFSSLSDRGELRRLHAEQSKQFQRPVELLIWPETSLHYALVPGTKSARQLLGPLATAVLFGGLTQGPASSLYNSAYLADAGGRVLGRTDKQHLIPFAEYVPLSARFPALDRWLPNSGQFVAGPEAGALPLGSHRLGVSLCYEDLLPGFVRQAVARTNPHLLVNLSNDVWFGRSSATQLHEALAILRAVENRRYLVRANNSGVSAAIDPTGEVVARTTPFARENLVAQVAWLDGETLYTHVGELIAWLALAATLLGSLWPPSQRRA